MNRITFSRGHIDYTCVVLGSLGFSAQFIGDETGLSTGQVYYRLKKAGIRLTDYRRGTSAVAKEAASRGFIRAERIVRKVVIDT